MKKIILPAVLISLLLSTSISFLIVKLLETEYKDESLKLSEWGDYVGGIYGTIISFLGLVATILASIFVYSTLQLQRTQLDHQKKTEYFNRVSGLIVKKLDTLNEEIIKFSQDIKVEEIQMENIEGWEVLDKLIRLEDLKAKFEFNYLKQHPIKINELYNCFQITKDLRSRICEAYLWFIEMIEDKNMNFDAVDQKSLNRIIIQGMRTKLIRDFFESTNRVLEFRNEVLEVEIQKLTKKQTQKELEKLIEQSTNQIAITSQYLVVNFIDRN